MRRFRGRSAHSTVPPPTAIPWASRAGSLEPPALATAFGPPENARSERASGERRLGARLAVRREAERREARRDASRLHLFGSSEVSCSDTRSW
jgi:hypothetical protein